MSIEHKPNMAREQQHRVEAQQCSIELQRSSIVAMHQR
jgi:hypothetical protein